MKDRVFVDTNLLVYAISTDAIKADKIEHLFRKPFDFVISTQVVNEFVHTCHRKNLLPINEIRQVVEDFMLFFNLATIEKATILIAFDLKSRYGFSWYDALIVAVALENGCETLYSEDLHQGLVVEGSLVIENPFLT